MHKLKYDLDLLLKKGQKSKPFDTTRTAALQSVRRFRLKHNIKVDVIGRDGNIIFERIN